MILKRIQAANFMRFKSLDFSGLPEKGLIGILGANESGKSTIGDVISYGLFGKCTRAPRGERERIISWGQNTAEVRITFEVADRVYEVYRRVRIDGPTDAYILETGTGREIAVGAAQVEQKLTDLLGFGFREFRFSTYIAQKELSIILDVSADRRDVLDKMLGIRKLREVSRAVSKKSVALRRDIELEETLLMEKTRALDSLNERKVERARIKERIAELEAELNKQQKERDRIQGLIDQLKETRSIVYRIEAQENRLNVERDRLREIERQTKELRDKQTEIINLEEEVKKSRMRIANIEESLAEVEKELDIQRTYRDLSEKIKARRKQMDDKRQELSGIKNRLADVESKEKIIHRLEDELREIIGFLENNSERDAEAGAQRLRAAIERSDSARKRALSELLRRGEAWGLEEKEVSDKTARLRDRIEATNLEEMDRDEIIAMEEFEFSLRTKFKNLLLMSIIPVAAAIIPGLSLGNPWFGLIGLGSVALWAGAWSTKRRILSAHEQLALAQQRQYAFNITRRNLQQMQEDLEFMEELHRQSIQRSDALNQLVQTLQNQPRQCFADIKNLYKTLSSRDDPLFEEWTETLRETFVEFDRLCLKEVDDEPIESVIIKALNLIQVQTARRKEILETLSKLRGDTIEKPVLLRKYDSLATEMEGGTRLIGDLEHEMPRDRNTEDEFNALIQKRTSLTDELQQLKKNVAEMIATAEDYRGEIQEMPQIQGRRDGVMSTIDRGLEELYKLKSGIKGEDCTDERFHYFLDRERKVEDEILRLTQETAYLSGEVKAVTREIEAEEQIQKELRKIRGGIELFQDRIKKYGMLERLYLEAAENIKGKMLPQIKAYFTWILPKLTNDRYHRVKIDDDFNIRVFSLEREDYVDLVALSGGTVDQLFIALRLAFAKAVSVGDTGRYRQMLFLDEPFSSFDATRRRQFFDLLRSLEANFQQIFIISHLPGLEEYLNAVISLPGAESRECAAITWSGPKN